MKANKDASVPERLMSLDALRGLDMFFLVGISGILQTLPEISDNSAFRWFAGQCEHPDWHGFTAYDLIFPMFIFIVGVSMPFSFVRRLEQKGGKKKLLKHVFIRTLILAILGVLLWQSPGGPHPEWGYYSVLYRIGISYFFASLVMMNTSIRGQVYWTFGLLAGYYLLMRFVPVPGHGMGNLDKGSDMASYIGNQVSAYLSPYFRHVLSITLIPTISTALMGVLAGHWLRSDRNPMAKAKGLMIGGTVLIISSFIIHLDFPINKNLWSPSFVFLTTGITALLLSFFYWLIDIRGYRKWAFFFVVVGMNSITIYVARWILKFYSLADVFVGGFDFGNARNFALAIVVASLEWLFLYYLYRQKVFLRI
jgi:predicted acyltransferase